MTGQVGLRRFARPAATADELLGRLALGGPGPAEAVWANGADERCEMCGTPLEVRHGHVVDTERRSLACTCRACYLLFTAPGAARGKCRAVPDRILHDPTHPLSTVDWEALRVPVGTAFFFINSALARVVGCYPSPSGATECELELGEWQRLAEAYPLLREPTPDLEGVLVNRTPAGVEAYLLPIDMCYALVGEIRLRWRGLDGGSEVHEAMAAFLADVRDRSVPLSAVDR